MTETNNSLSPIGRRAFFVQTAKYGLAAATLGGMVALGKGCVSAAPGCGYCDFPGQDYDICGDYCDYFNYLDGTFKEQDTATRNKPIPRSDPTQVK